MKNFDINKIKSLLSKPKKIVIVPHRNPDGDAMGSTLGLYHFLLKLNHEVVVISPNEFPEFLEWLPASEKVLIYEKQITETNKIINEVDLIFTLDFNALHRVGEMETALKSASCPFVMIDHHQKPDDFAEFTYSDTDFGSTCEMVYNFIEFESGGEQLISNKKLSIESEKILKKSLELDDRSYKVKGISMVPKYCSAFKIVFYQNIDHLYNEKYKLWR
jgi:phosphoesterase RecJ-like protein